jgi:hypothetical protein
MVSETGNAVCISRRAGCSQSTREVAPNACGMCRTHPPAGSLRSGCGDRAREDYERKEGSHGRAQGAVGSGADVR